MADEHGRGRGGLDEMPMRGGNGMGGGFASAYGDEDDYEDDFDEEDSMDDRLFGDMYGEGGYGNSHSLGRGGRAG